MNKELLPFNVDLFLPRTPPKGLLPVTSLAIFDGKSRNFHEEGLFSTTIFGLPGTQLRSTRFGYIDLKVEIIHPKILNLLNEIRTLYTGILAGSQYAKWNEETKDFDESNSTEGGTGYYFFMSKFKDIVFRRTKSRRRDDRIRVLNKYRDMATLSYWLVGPAGLRDVEFSGESTRIEKDEINDIYYEILATANTVDHITVKNNPKSLDQVRWSLQNKVMKVYDYIVRLVFSKEGFFDKKMASRSIHQATRNVITALDTTIYDLDDPNNVREDQCVIGLYQFIMGSVDLTCHALRNSFLGKSFLEGTHEAWLTEINGHTASKVEIKHGDYEMWTSREGLAKILTLMADVNERDDPVVIDGMYLGLCYTNSKGEFKFVKDVNDVPDWKKQGEYKDYEIHPITLAEMIYDAVAPYVDKTAAISTRYPVLNMGSAAPSLLYLKSTIQSVSRVKLDDEWNPVEGITPYHQFPTRTPYFDSYNPHVKLLAQLGGDFDGDQMTISVLWSEESTSEIRNLLVSRAGYVNVDGNLIYSNNTDLRDLILNNITG